MNFILKIIGLLSSIFGVLFFVKSKKLESKNEELQNKNTNLEVEKKQIENNYEVKDFEKTILDDSEKIENKELQKSDKIIEKINNSKDEETYTVIL